MYFLNKKVVWATLFLMLVVASPLAALPIYTVDAASTGSFSLVADFANNLFAVVIGASPSTPPALLDVSAPVAGQLLAAPDGASTNSFLLATLDTLQAAQVAVDFGTRSTSPSFFFVSGVGTPITAVSNLGLGAALQPLSFTFGLVTFDAQTSVGIYSLTSFETVNANGSVPEPSTAALGGIGLAVLAAWRLRRRGRR